MKYDFAGWVTRNNIKCSDGRTIMQNAFAHDNGLTVPLVWNHKHDSPFNVLGQVTLENRPEGVYGYGKFNETEQGINAKALVTNGDVTSLSICANGLKHQGSNVTHGDIREVSLVLAGANPGAYIDSVVTHADGADEEAIIYNGSEDLVTDVELVLKHSDDKNINTDNGAPQNNKAKEDKKDMPDQNKKTVKAIFDTLTEEQKAVVYALVGQAIDDAKKGKIKDDNDEGDDDINKEGKDDMKHNVFENDAYYGVDQNAMQHAAKLETFNSEVIADAKRYGSLKESCLAHGIEDIDWLFPEDHVLDNPPAWLQRDMDWVGIVMSGVHHTPYSRIKSRYADITADDARAKGYLKGNYKREEVFTLLKRSTAPTTVYKKQKLDRDDVIDITDYDVVSWLKGEMRMMLDEELARAYLFGDGRPSSSDDKINESNIRPVWTDEDLYTIKATVVDTGDEEENARAFIKKCIRARKDYKGSASPIMFISEDLLTTMLLLTDGVGRDLYESVEKLATKLRVSKIVTVPVMDNLQRVDGQGKIRTLGALILGLNSYNVGADKGGAINMFDDFDIDYNAQKYLIETRCSGALIEPYSAIAVEFVEGGDGEFNNPTVSPVDGEETVFATLVSDMQEDISISGNRISGTLKYLADGPIAERWGAGNFIVLKLTDIDPTLTSIKVGMNPSQSSGLVEIIDDPDKSGVFKVTNKKNQKFVVVSTDGTNERTLSFNLDGLRITTH